MPAIEHTGLYHLHRGSCPVLVNVPHAGTCIPPSLADRLTTHAADLPDTDWHVERLYDFVGDLGALGNVGSITVRKGKSSLGSVIGATVTVAGIKLVSI